MFNDAVLAVQSGDERPRCREATALLVKAAERVLPQQKRWGGESVPGVGVEVSDGS